jgi:hypothetical protein
VIFLAFGGNCRKLSSKIGHNFFGKSKKSQTRRMTAKARSRIATYPEERYSRKSTDGSPIHDLTGSGWLAEK